MTFPTVHLNGTGRTGLQTQLQDAHTALQKAIDALCEAAPHGRDYYTQGPDAYQAARAEHYSRLERVQAVQTEIRAIFEAIS